jgi:hypothetical protein
MPVSYCSKCGAKLPESGASFCPSCGAPVPSVPRTPATSHKVFAISGRAKVIVKVTVPGSIDVRKGSEGEIAIDTRVTEPDLIDVEIIQNGNIVTVKTHTKSWDPFRWGSHLLSLGPRTSITIATPEQTDLDLETQTDPIKVNGLSGTLNLDSKTGSIQLNACSGTISAITHTGSLNFDDVNGTISSRATTGPTRFVGNLSNNASAFRSTAGTIEIVLVGEQNLAIDASTTVGQITCTLDLRESRYEKGQFIGQQVSGKVGTGTGRLSVETTVGSISIHK